MSKKISTKEHRFTKNELEFMDWLDAVIDAEIDLETSIHQGCGTSDLLKDFQRTREVRRDFFKWFQKIDKKEIPMGVSQWCEHGEKYGYWGYFVGKFIKERNKEIISWTKRLDKDGCDWVSTEKIREYLKQSNPLTPEKYG